MVENTQQTKPKKLSKLVKKSLKNSGIELPHFRLLPRLRDFVRRKITSARWSSYVIIPLYLGFFMPLGINPNILHQNSTNYLPELWTVQGGILAITVTVVVFIIQSINSRYTRQNIFKIFVRKSFIFPIIYLNLINIAGISSLLFYFNPSKQMGLVHLIYGMFLFCIFLIGRLYKTVFNFLNPTYVQATRIQELKRTFETFFVEELEAKIAEISLYRLCNIVGAEYDPWKIEFKNPIRSTIIGKIVDIDFRKIVKILRKITKTEEGIFREKVKAFVIKSIGMFVNENSQLMDIADDTLSDSDKKRLVSAFKIREGGTKEAQLSLSLNELQDEAGLAIRDHSTEGMRNVSTVYKEIMTQLSIRLKQYNDNYLDEVQPPFSGFDWLTLDMILDKFIYLIPNSFSVEKRDFVEHVISIPDEIIGVAVKNRDITIITRLMGIYLKFYHFSHQINNENVKRFIQYKSWLRPLQVCKHEILSPLNEKESKFKDIDFETSVCEKTIILLLGIMKQAVDRKDKYTFEELGDALNKFANRYHEFRCLDNYSKIESELRGPKILSETEREDLETELKWLGKLMKLWSSLRKKKFALWHALGAWLIEKYIEGEIDLEEFKTFYNIIERRFTSLRDLIESTANVIFDQRDLGLDSWKFTEIGNWIRLPALIFYIDKGVRLSPSEFPESHPALSAITRGVGDAINFVKEDEARWVGKIINEDSWNKVEEFLELNKSRVV